MMNICLVSPELAPFTAGGIGVLLHNLIQEYQSQDIQFHVLALGNWDVDDVSFAITFPKVRLWQVEKLVARQESGRHPPESAFTTHPWHYQSYQVAQALHELASHGLEFDVVEFPDWGGLGFCSCQEKLLGNWGDTKIAIRLHSTDSILRAGQPVTGSASAAHMADLERKALRDSDIIVAHLESIAQATKTHFGFDDEWWAKVRVDAPPISMEARTNAISFEADTPICFPSKIQALKRPEVFLNGALAFLNETPDYKGKIVFMAHPTDARLLQHLKSRVPEHLSDRVSFSLHMPQNARSAMLTKSISVFPSPFESFCLSAYEASMMGGWVVLNADNPAFCAETAWQDGKNCLKFDGTALGLAERLGRAWHARTSLRMAPINHRPTATPYWLRSPPDGSAASFGNGSEVQVERVQMPLVSVVIPYFNMGRYIARTLESVLASTYANLEIILVDDCSTDPHSRGVLHKIQQTDRFGTLRIVAAPANVGLSAARNLGIRAARGAYIITLDSDDLIREDFIAVAVKALERNPHFSIVVPQTAFIADEASPTQMKVVDHAVFIGEAMRGGSFSNRFSTATSLGRRELYTAFPYDETLNSYEDWDFYSRLAWAGKRFIVTSEIYFYYRRRAGSMIANNTNDKHIRNLSILRSKQQVHLSNFSFDMNVMSDAEGYAEFLHTHAVTHAANRDRGRGENTTNVEQMRLRLEQQDVQLKEAHKKLAAIQVLVAGAGQADVCEGVRRPRNPIFFAKLRRDLAVKKATRALMASGHFDAEWYLAKYPDVARSGIDPARHYVLFGRDEGRAPMASGPF